MSEAKFTKGPWIFDKRGEHLQGASNKKVIFWGCGFASSHRTEEREANSVLARHSPEMYAMLQFLVDNDSINDASIDKEVIALLAKARGETNA